MDGTGKFFFDFFFTTQAPMVQGLAFFYARKSTGLEEIPSSFPSLFPSEKGPLGGIVDALPSRRLEPTSATQ